MTMARAETLFGNYFDIKTGSAGRTEVNGKIHLLSNKDAHKTPVPSTYHFVITSDPSGLFEVVDQRDSISRLWGMLRVKTGLSVSANALDYPVSVSLLDGSNSVAQANVVIHAVSSPLYDGFLDSAKSRARGEPRLYGSTSYIDSAVASLITEVENNGGRFIDVAAPLVNGQPQVYAFYTTPISTFIANHSYQGDNWAAVASKIGGLGKAYATSPKYGPGGTVTDHARLKSAIYSAMRAFLDRIMLDPAAVIVPSMTVNNVLVPAHPIGTDYGDGFYRLSEYGVVSYNDLTHQWRFTDPLLGPAAWIMADLLAEMRTGDQTAADLHERLVRFFQICYGNQPSYRIIDSPDARWGNLTDTQHTEGAFSDANLGHRFRGWMMLPAVWADYNRPITYMPYWYGDYYTQYPGTLYMPGWTPHGVLDDFVFWVRHAFRNAHMYVQSGFQPDGTVSHHTDFATDIAMNAYGGEWMIEPIYSYQMLQGSGFDLGSYGYQFISDHYLYTYDKMVYRGDFDFTVSGRGYYADFKNKFVNAMPGNITRLLAAKQPGTLITNEAQLSAWGTSITQGAQQATGNFPFWVGNYMVHRNGGASSNPASFFFSVKMASDLTTGAEDFDSVGKSWHAGSGVLQCKVGGAEYDVNVKKRWDWHALPGVTEEWRNDAIPSGDQNKAGGSNFAGMASDGVTGFAAMEYRSYSGQSYSVAQADKAFFFPGSEAIALGANVARRATGQGRTIITTVDQTAWVSNLTYSVNNATPTTVIQGTSVDFSLPLSGPTWVHQGSTGYVIFPQGQQPLHICGGAAVVDTDTSDTSTTPIIHLALEHGRDPAAASLTNYYYIIVPNITAAEMPAYLAVVQSNIEVVSNGNGVQGIYDHALGTVQLAFHAPTSVMTSTGLQVSVDRAALVHLRRNGDNWEVSASDPTSTYENTEINITLNLSLKAGSYSNVLPGLYPMMGEAVTVKEVSNGVTVKFPLPDPTDDASLNYQAELYAGVPMHVSIPSVPAPTGLVHYLPLNENSGTASQDVTGNGLNGTLVNGTAWTSGAQGRAVSLDGLDDTVTTPVLSDLSTNTLTITGWIKRSGSQTQWAGLIFSRNAAYTSGLMLGAGNELRYSWKGGDYNWGSGLIVPDDTWTFVALVIQPASATLYLDGGQGMQTSVHNVAHAPGGFNAAIQLGWDTYSAARRFRGAIDEVRFYNRALSPEELQIVRQPWRVSAPNLP